MTIIQILILTNVVTCSLLVLMMVQNFSRKDIINKLKKKGFESKFINTVLEALDLRHTGMPKYEPPLPPTPDGRNKKRGGDRGSDTGP